MLSTAIHRPALKKRRYRHDEYIAGDLFSGFGGSTEGLKRAGLEVIVAANHNQYKTEIHEANHPDAEHWIADLVNTDSPNYHSVRDLPVVDVLSAGVTCTNHSHANTMKAYEQRVSLFDLEDPEFQDRVTRSERDRATANCVLHYAAEHHPLLILVECTTELASWGPAVPGKRKVGDGTTYKWWLKQFGALGYRHRVLYLNSMFFGVGQSRDRGYWIFWDRRLATPDLDHRPESWCPSCQTVVQAVWTWKTGAPPTGLVCYGKQYNYRCPSCRHQVIPPFTPSLDVLDLSDLGTRIGDREKPLASSTMARAERCRQRFPEFPAVLMPAKAQRGSERHPWQPMSTQTSQQETALLSTGRLIAALGVDNFQGAPRGVDESLPTQTGSETMALLTGVIPYRKNTTPRTHAEPMPTVTADQIPGLLTAAGRVQCNGSIAEAQYRAYPVDRPLGTVVGSAVTQGLLFSGWYKQNGSSSTDTAAHPVTDPLGTITSRDTTALLTADWHATLAGLSLDDCYFRMMFDHEIGRGCGFDVDFPGHQGTFKVWGSVRKRVDGYGNAVNPPVMTWIGGRVRPILHGESARHD